MIAGQRIKIQTTDLDSAYGQYLHERKTIQLDTSLTDREYVQTLRHEILHASFHISGLSFCEGFQEEACIRCIDEVFFPAYERILKRLK
jgi:Zn-dependent peptidase ImmA (M78 family)|tara:strand:+ start:227 stop:493 length:267 start_codon:yes stop_codon:yes gene_type:complete